MRISTTTLESYRLFKEQDWMTESDLIATIEGKFVPTPKVLLGQAYGRILEDPDRYLVGAGYRCGGYSFGIEDVRPALMLIDRRGVFEAKATKRYGDCDVVAVADHLFGAHLSEFKTTEYFSVEKYLDSCQWKFYVDIFEPLQVTYHVFSLDDHGNGVAELKGIDSFNVFPYPTLHDDCAALVQELAHFVTVKGLDGLLRERQAAAA
jgi:hypothetical protein